MSTRLITLMIIDPGYFDVNGNCIIDLKQYTERYIFRNMGAFLNGHTGVIMEAKDNGSKFYACFDSQGNLMYEPFMCEGRLFGY